jgi:hypothetical protein
MEVGVKYDAQWGMNTIDSHLSTECRVSIALSQVRRRIAEIMECSEKMVKLDRPVYSVDTDSISLKWMVSRVPQIIIEEVIL